MSRHLKGLLCAIAAAVLLAPATAGSVVYEPEPSFCQQRIAHDHLSALEKLPRFRWPESGRLGFAPRVRLFSLPQLVSPFGAPNPTTVGYKLTAGRGGGTARPGWNLTATLTRISWHGRVLERIGRAEIEGRSLSPGVGGGRRWDVGEEPGAYRLTLVFRSAAGKLLASLGRYFRVVQPVENVRLVLDPGAYRREETVFAQLRNFGTTRWGYGLGARIDRFNGSDWEEAPENPRMPVPAIGLMLGPGAAGECESFWIPPTMQLGRYRITFGGLPAEFDVLP